MAFANRSNGNPSGAAPRSRLIRPTLAEMKLPGQRGKISKPRTKAAPPEQTNAESFYYLKQMNARTPMVIMMTDGEEIRGWIEWYDRACIKVNREDAPNLLIQKHCIKYMCKEEDMGGNGHA
ncbi:MAG TPA: hypothetical protein VMT00_15035 [Thermoanaerobaculia bacterium]|nr:hypothetical protein [Thermoanaerobaculia bacterium]